MWNQLNSYCRSQRTDLIISGCIGTAAALLFVVVLPKLALIVLALLCVASGVAFAASLVILLGFYIKEKFSEWIGHNRNS